MGGSKAEGGVGGEGKPSPKVDLKRTKGRRINSKCDPQGRTAPGKVFLRGPFQNSCNVGLEGANPRKGRLRDEIVEWRGPRRKGGEGGKVNLPPNGV